jgi:hypothetical protein
MNWKFWKKKDKPDKLIINEKKKENTIKKWSSSLIRESTIKNNGKEYIIIDIGYHWVVVRDTHYNTYQIQRNLLE